MLKTVLIAVCLFATCSSLFAGDVSGTILQLDGKDIPQLTGFQVTAQVGGVIVARGNLATTQAPFKYTINIPDNRLNPQDVRVRLVFTAVGRQTVVLDGIAGNAIHDIKVIMPEDTFVPCCCRCCRRRR